MLLSHLMDRMKDAGKDDFARDSGWKVSELSGQGKMVDTTMDMVED